MKAKIHDTNGTLELVGMGDYRQIGQFQISAKDYAALKMAILEHLKEMQHLSQISSFQRWFNCPYVVIETAMTELIQAGYLDNWNHKNNEVNAA